MAKTDFKSVDEYIATHPEDVQAILRRVRGAIRNRPPRRGVQGRPRPLRGQQGHDPFPALPARSRQAHRAPRQVPRAGDPGEGADEVGRKEALGSAGAATVGRPCDLAGTGVPTRHELRSDSGGPVKSGAFGT